MINIISHMYHKHRTSKQYKPDSIPMQFADYINQQSTRFSDICKIYLDGMNMDDVKYMCPEDLINLVPSKQYKHKLLMTILVRRYIINDLDNDEDHVKICKPEKRMCDINDNDSSINDASDCDKCSNECVTTKCNHKCKHRNLDCIITKYN